MPLAPGTACVCGGIRRQGVCMRCGPRKRTPHAKTTTDRLLGWTWQKFRLRILKERPTCEDQALNHPGQVKAPYEVHHIIKREARPDLAYEPTNVLSLCKDCHQLRTNRCE
jgi:5-methylcytosine-specific restriction endonuclease McrA